MSGSGSAYASRAASIDFVRRLAAAVPTWAWMTAIVAVSVAVRAVISRRTPAPWIFDDELIYASLAESFGTSGTFVLRGVHGLLGFGPGYPILISPAYAIFGDAADAYEAAKALNALMMSLTAVPVYLIARSVLGRWQSLAAAALAVTIPSLAYTSVIMTENAFYPAFLFCALAFVRTLVRPSYGRQAVALVAIGLACAVRVQAIVLVPALATALLVHALLETRASADGLQLRPLLRRLDAFRATWLALGLGALVIVAIQAVRGETVGSLLGAYEVVADRSYSVGALAEWALYHLAELDLYLGILPFAALLVVCAVACRRVGVSAQQRAFTAVSASLVFWLVLSAAAVASQYKALDGIDRIEERNVFYVAPLFLIALLIWVDQGLGRYRVATLVAAAVAAELPAVIPYARFVNLSTLSDTLAFVPLARLVEGGELDLDQIATLVVIGSIGAAIVFVLLPRRLAFVAPLLVAGYFVVWQTSVYRQIHGTSSFIATTTVALRPGWIDDAVGTDADVATLWSGGVNGLAIEQNEFFNRSLKKVYAIAPALPLGQQLPELPSTMSPRTGELLDEHGLPLRSPYVLADAGMVIRGVPLASDPGIGLTVYRTAGAVRVRERVSGRHGDGWTGPRLTYTRFGCRPGRLYATFSRYPGLVPGRQTVVAFVGGRPAGRAVLPDSASKAVLLVPLRRQAGGRCDVTLAISPTASPADVVGGADTRMLGVHVDELRYWPRGRRPGRP